jgi:hypothetical protein
MRAILCGQTPVVSAQSDSLKPVAGSQRKAAERDARRFADEAFR